MLRKFVKCVNTEDRLAMLERTSVKDWTSKELDSVLDIIGFGEISKDISDEDKFQTIWSNLATRKVA
ncbi:MAG: hypothetical protein ACLRZ7_08890 [Lachnospiraceae bacterium]